MASPPSIDERNFPITLRNARERAGLTQRELGERAGVNFSQISRYEQGLALPRPGMLLKLAEALGVTPEFLRKGEDLVHVDLVDPDGGRIPIALPSSEMDLIRQAATANGRTVEEEIVSMVMNGIRAFEGELEFDTGEPRPEQPKPKRNKD